MQKQNKKALPRRNSWQSVNIRYENDKDGKNSWTLRRELVGDVIKAQNPDLLGLQESKPSQTLFVKECLREKYDNYARGRDYHNTDEAMAIYYKRERFHLMNKGTFWLSEDRYQPGTILKGSYFQRICSWVKLFDKEARKEIFYFNTHFDHENKSIRTRNSEILLQEIDMIAQKGENVILSGDFNANDGENCIELIKKRLRDTCSSPEYTFHNFWGYNCLIGKIDFIFIGKSFEAKEFSNIKTSEKRNGSTRYPSDHYPITTTLSYKKA